MKNTKLIPQLILLITIAFGLQNIAHADVMVWLSKCVQNLMHNPPTPIELMLTENSGFVSEYAASQILPVRLVDRNASALRDSTGSALWNATFPYLKKQGQLYYLSVDSRIYPELNELRLESEFELIQEAINKPMIPVPSVGGGYLVYFGYKSTSLWAGRYDHFALFSSLDYANNFINSHEFQTEPSPTPH